MTMIQIGDYGIPVKNIAYVKDVEVAIEGYRGPGVEIILKAESAEDPHPEILGGANKVLTIPEASTSEVVRKANGEVF